jgi:hypothetical protein
MVGSTISDLPAAAALSAWVFTMNLVDPFNGLSCVFQ